MIDMETIPIGTKLLTVKGNIVTYIGKGEGRRCDPAQFPYMVEYPFDPKIPKNKSKLIGTRNRQGLVKSGSSLDDDILRVLHLNTIPTQSEDELAILSIML